MGAKLRRHWSFGGLGEKGVRSSSLNRSVIPSLCDKMETDLGKRPT